MRKMSKGDVREWLPGESLERVDFGNGVTGMDKRCPKDDSDRGLKQLMWKCAAIAADGGPHVKVAFCDYWIDGQKGTGTVPSELDGTYFIHRRIRLDMVVSQRTAERLPHGGSSLFRLVCHSPKLLQRHVRLVVPTP